MRFYYLSFVGAGIIACIYRLGTSALLWAWSRRRWGDPGVWKIMLPLFFVLYVSPVAEEFWIAWKFADLCQHQAGTRNERIVNTDVSRSGDQTERVAVSSPAHKITRRERLVVSGGSGEFLQRVTDFQRQPPWFSLDSTAAEMSCMDLAGHDRL